MLAAFLREVEDMERLAYEREARVQRFNEAEQRLLEFKSIQPGSR